MWSCECAHTFGAHVPVHVMSVCAFVWYVHIHKLHVCVVCVSHVCTAVNTLVVVCT